jgi:hypothetical protein
VRYVSNEFNKARKADGFQPPLRLALCSKGERMNLTRGIFLFAIIFAAASAGANDETYLVCLKDSFNGSHSFSAEEVRSLCMEISGTQNPSYSLREEKMVPNNEFTECYKQQEKELKVLGEERSGKIAKIICRYEAR